MAKHTTLQYFSSMAQLKETYHVVLPRPYDWHLIARPAYGQIHGIPTMRGVAIATNGILVAIIQENDCLTIGHLDNFIPDDVEVDVKVLTAKPVTRKPTTHEVDIMEFV